MHARIPALLGVIHLPALPGSPHAKSLGETGLRAVKEALLLQKEKFQGIILENFGDVPFYKDRVPAETIASLAIIAAAVRESTRLSLGINVLRNDAMAALSIAHVVGANFIRVNVLSGVVATDQGLIEGCAAELIRQRDRKGSDVQILADAHVKHAKTLSSDRVDLAIEDLAKRAMADGVIVTGTGTGKKVDADHLKAAYLAARRVGTPLYIGSGAEAEDLGELLSMCDGVIVGSAIRKGGRAGEPLDHKRLRAFSKAFYAVKRKKR